jgi:mRNA interferase RelE/StbE
VARYSLLIKLSASRELEAVNQKADRQKLVARIEALADNPRPRGCEKLAGFDDRFRLRQGDFRVVYSVDDRGHTIVVVKIGHRREVYRTD